MKLPPVLIYYGVLSPYFPPSRYGLHSIWAAGFKTTQGWRAIGYSNRIPSTGYWLPDLAPDNKPDIGWRQWRDGKRLPDATILLKDFLAL